MPIRWCSSPKGEALWSVDDALAAAGLKNPAKALKSAPGLPRPVHRLTEEKGRREMLRFLPEATFFAILAAGTTDRSRAFRFGAGRGRRAAPRLAMTTARTTPCHKVSSMRWASRQRAVRRCKLGSAMYSS